MRARVLSFLVVSCCSGMVLACGHDGSSGPVGPVTTPTPPTIDGAVLTWNRGRSTNPNTHSFTDGDTILVDGTAHDRSGIAWIGLEAGDPIVLRDSFAVSSGDTSFAYRYWLTFPHAPLGGLPLRVFVRNFRGQRTEAMPEGGADVWLFPTTRPAVSTVALPTGWSRSIYDPKRDVFYWANWDGHRIDVVSHQTLQTIGSVALLGPPSSLDLTAGGDTLLITMAAVPYVGVVNLGSASLVLDTIRVRADTVGDEQPDAVVALATNSALVWVRCAACPEQSRFVTIDLASGAQRVRDEAGPADRIVDGVAFLETEDHSRVYVTRIHDGPWTALTYDVPTDSFSPVFPIYDGGGLNGATRSGDVLLSGAYVLDATGHLVRNLYPPLYQPELNEAGTLAPSGAFAVFSTRRGVLRVRMPDGRPLELIATPTAPAWVSILPGERELVAGAWDYPTFMTIPIGPPASLSVRPQLAIRAGQR